MNIRSLAVFCGSKSGNQPDYASDARMLGRMLAENQVRLVYGGGGIGLMGILADAVLSAGGKVYGVIPRFLADKELGHQDLDELILTDTMHQRKQKMAELADGFIAMPGGYGTMEELFEIITWVQLEIIRKPVGLLNSKGYYDHLLRFLDHMTRDGFLSELNRNLLITGSNSEELLRRILKTGSFPDENPEKLSKT